MYIAKDDGSSSYKLNDPLYCTCFWYMLTLFTPINYRNVLVWLAWAWYMVLISCVCVSVHWYSPYHVASSAVSRPRVGARWSHGGSPKAGTGFPCSEMRSRSSFGRCFLHSRFVLFLVWNLRVSVYVCLTSTNRLLKASPSKKQQTVCGFSSCQNDCSAK